MRREWQWRQALLGVIVVVLSVLVFARDTAASDNQPLLVGVQQLSDIPSVRAVSHIKFIIEGVNAVAVDGDPFVISRFPFVRYVHSDPPNAVHTQDQALPWGVDKIDAEQVWSINRGTGIKVAILDTGIDCGHEDLVPDCNYGANFVAQGLPFDDHGHGTHVAGIAAARDNAVGYIGVAPESSLWAVKALDSNGSGSWGQVAAGIDWARQNGMEIISMSLSGLDYDQTVADAIQLAYDQGVLIISAAGNSGGCSTCDTVAYPARYPGSMAIAATDINDTHASFSSTGYWVDVAASGKDVPSSVPTGTCTYCTLSGYKTLSGTSMATPHVSGLAALLLKRGFTMQQVWDQLEATALDLGVVGFDWLYGYGRVNALAAMTNLPSVPPSKGPPPVNQPPTISFFSPADGQILDRNMLYGINVVVHDDGQITRVRISWQEVGTRKGDVICDSSGMLGYCNWKVPAKPLTYYQLTGYVEDSQGFSALAVITVQSSK